MKNSFFATICGGIYKGKRLILPNSTSTRPTKSIVRESFFDSLGREICGKIFIEMFAGSAIMACNAISVGAKKSYAIEINKEIFSITNQNIKSLNNENLIALNGDSFVLTADLVAQNEGIILYIDPPFEIRENFDRIYEKIIEFLMSCDDGRIFLIVFEHISSHEMPQNFGNFSLVKSKKFGKTTLSYYKKLTDF